MASHFFLCAECDNLRKVHLHLTHIGYLSPSSFLLLTSSFLPSFCAQNATVRAFRHYNDASYQDAIRVYGEAIALIRKKKGKGASGRDGNADSKDDGIVISPVDQARLHYNRARASFQLERKAFTLEECDKALDLVEDYNNALSLRAECRLALFEFAPATSDFERLVEVRGVYSSIYCSVICSVICSHSQ